MPRLGGNLAANQFVELDLIGGRDDFAIAVIDFELRRRDFRVIFFILKTHGALYFGHAVNERAERIARQAVIVTAGVDVFERLRAVVALSVDALEEEAFNLVRGVQRQAFLLVQVTRELL